MADELEIDRQIELFGFVNRNFEHLTLIGLIWPLRNWFSLKKNSQWLRTIEITKPKFKQRYSNLSRISHSRSPLWFFCSFLPILDGSRLYWWIMHVSTGNWDRPIGTEWSIDAALDWHSPEMKRKEKKRRLEFACICENFSFFCERWKTCKKHILKIYQMCIIWPPKILIPCMAFDRHFRVKNT